MDDPGTSPRVLVVDDEHSIVDAVSTALRYEGFAIDTAMSGRAALSAAQEGDHDLIVLDVMLPDFDGFEIARRLRADGVEVPSFQEFMACDLDDAGVYRLLQRSDTLGVFQLESSGMRALLKQLRPTLFDDIVA